jgi:hypothetical protein
MKKSKLGFLTLESLKRKVKTKWFLVANLLIALVLVGAVNIDKIITSFGGDFDSDTIIYVVDKTDRSFDIFKSQFEIKPQFDLDEGSKYILKKTDKTNKEIKTLLNDKKEASNIFVIFDNDEIGNLKATIVTKEFLNTSSYARINGALQNTKVVLAISDSNVSEEELTAIYSEIKVERKVLDQDKKSEEENMNMIMTTAFPIIILPFFILTIFLVQMIGAEVNDEKSTRGMEIIISNVSPKTHFASKVIAGNLFVLLQGFLLTFYTGFGFLVRNLTSPKASGKDIVDGTLEIFKGILESNVGDKLIYIIPITLLLMILTFIAYSLLAGILASMTTNIEDFQQLQTPIMIISLTGYYLAMMAGVFDGAIFIKIAAFIPLISAILAPCLLLLGQMSIIEFLIAIVLVIGTNFLLIKYGLKIYKAGILNYSSSKLWKKMFKAIKE